MLRSRIPLSLVRRRAQRSSALLSTPRFDADRRQHFLSTEAELKARQEHERRVAEAQQAVVLLQRTKQSSSRKRGRTKASNVAADAISEFPVPAPSPKQVPSAPADANSKRHSVANSIQHWLSKDPQFFHATMQALNLSSLATTTAPSSSQKEHPLSFVVQQYRQLYFESIYDFRAYINSDPPSLRPVLDQLIQAGFGDSVWSKRHRQVKSYENHKVQQQVAVERQAMEVQRRRELVQFALAELEVLKGTARKSARDQREIYVKRRNMLERKRHVEELRLQIKDVFEPKSNQTSSADTVPSPTWWSKLTSWFISPPTPSSQMSSIEPQETAMPILKQEKKPLSVQNVEPIDDDDDLPIYEPNFLPSNRQQKRVRAKLEAIQVLELDVSQAQEELENLQLRVQSLRPSLPMEEYERGQEAVNQARDALCQELAQRIGERHAQLIEQYQRLDAKTDLTKPHEWFSYARLDRRKIIFHSGPTNSGKTYNALERLKEAKRGLYLGPLRLLAAEIYENLTADGVYTNLFTGQERREIAFSTHASATVEMFSLDKEYDVVVVDEIQMIADAARGAAWTKALLGLRCKEIHVCGGAEAKTIVKKLADACGDEFEVKEYERFSPLKVAKKSMSRDPAKAGCYRNVKPGDCVVAFSRNDIFAIKREIEKTTNYKCCVIYGKLPPQTRADQARRFNDPSSGYDILVASDAIGMGLNLNIKRIIFNSIFKYNGEEVVRLTHSEVKQISGRAGRRNSPYPHGEVTCRDPRDLRYIQKCLATDIPQIEKAALLPTSDHIELFSEGLQAYDVGGEATDLDTILRQFSAMATVKGDFFLGRQTEMQIIAKSLKGIPLTLKDAYMMCLSPTSDNSLYLLQSFARKLARGEVCGLPSRSVPKPAKSFDDLSYLCNVYGDADLFLWLQFKFPPSNAVEHQAALARKETTLAFINEALANTDRLSLEHDYIRTAIRHRAMWESENGPMDLEDPLLDESSSTTRDDEDGFGHHFDDDDEDQAYSSFSERREASY